MQNTLILIKLKQHKIFARWEEESLILCFLKFVCFLFINLWLLYSIIHGLEQKKHNGVCAYVDIDKHEFWNEIRCKSFGGTMFYKHDLS